MPELFLEILSEEMPARLERRAAQDLRRLVTGHLVDAGLTYEGAFASATPRRLILSVQGIPARSPDRREERRGPRVGAPEKAVEGFLRAAGLASLDEAEVASDPKKGDYYVARTLVPGRAAIDVAAEAIGETVRRFPWPVSMRWGAASAAEGSLRWVRPITSVVATFGPENEDPDIVPVDLDGVPVGQETVGHRVHAPGRIRVRRLSDYQPAMEKACVMIDLDRRREAIADGARNAAFAQNLELVADEGLLEEVAGLVEWPVVHVGRFDATALALPEEVIRLTIRANQKCFVTRDAATGRLANAFVLTANIAARDGGAAVIAGNERVVNARLADARFFWEQDRRVSLERHLEALKAMTFHERLGSQWERVERIAALTRTIAPLVGADEALAERAARLAKADLVTGMVGEFPELQGYMGRRYAEADGEAPEVAAAIEEHYRPLGPSDRVPAAPVSIAVALADKLTSLVSLWAADERPTGSGDAFGLRRAALGTIRIILENRLRLPLGTAAGGGLVKAAWDLWDGTPVHQVAAAENVADEVVDFLKERLVVQQRDAGTRADIVRAILPVLSDIDLVDWIDRIETMKRFLDTEDGAALIEGFRRAVNILRIEERNDGPYVGGTHDCEHLQAETDQDLATAVAMARSTVAVTVARGEYTEAMEALAKLRKPVDAFFEAVRVNDPDPDVRVNRLRLLAALRDVTREVADFSQISG